MAFQPTLQPSSIDLTAIPTLPSKLLPSSEIRAVIYCGAGGAGRACGATDLGTGREEFGCVEAEAVICAAASKTRASLKRLHDVMISSSPAIYAWYQTLTLVG